AGTNGASGGSVVAEQLQAVKVPSEMAELQAMGHAEVTALIRRAEAGDQATPPAVRPIMQSPRVGRLFGDLARWGARSFTHAIAGKNLMNQESVAARLAKMRKDLSGPNPTPLEKVLIQRVVATWLQVQHAELVFAQAENVSLALGDYHQRRLDRAH